MEGLPNDFVICALTEALKAVKVRIAFVGHPQEPMVDGHPDWSTEVKLIEMALSLARKAAG